SWSRTVSTAAIGICLLGLFGFGFCWFLRRRRWFLGDRLGSFGSVKYRSGVRHWRRFFAAELVNAGVDQPDQVLQRGVHEREQRRERCDHGREHLSTEHVERRQLRELIDV